MRTNNDPPPSQQPSTPTCLFNTAVSWKERTLLRMVTSITSIALAGKSYTHKITGQTENAGTSYAWKQRRLLFSRLVPLGGCSRGKSRRHKHIIWIELKYILSDSCVFAIQLATSSALNYVWSVVCHTTNQKTSAGADSERLRQGTVLSRDLYSANLSSQTPCIKNFSPCQENVFLSHNHQNFRCRLWIFFKRCWLIRCPWSVRDVMAAWFNAPSSFCNLSTAPRY